MRTRPTDYAKPTPSLALPPKRVTQKNCPDDQVEGAPSAIGFSDNKIELLQRQLDACPKSKTISALQKSVVSQSTTSQRKPVLQRQKDPGPMVARTGAVFRPLRSGATEIFGDNQYLQVIEKGDASPDFTAAPGEFSLVKLEDGRTGWIEDVELHQISKELAGIMEPVKSAFKDDKLLNQTALMNALNRTIEATLKKNPKINFDGNVFRLGSCVIAPTGKNQYDFAYRKLKDVPHGINKQGDELLAVAGGGELMRQFVFDVLSQSGQMAYLHKNWARLQKSGNAIVVSVDYYYDRPKNRVGLHKDSVGRTMFVNLNFNNKQEMAGPEYILNPEKVDAHQKHVEDKLPAEFQNDVNDARTQLPNAEDTGIQNSILEPNGMISFVDELVHHSTPVMAKRTIDDRKKNRLDELIENKETEIAELKLQGKSHENIDQSLKSLKKVRGMTNLAPAGKDVSIHDLVQANIDIDTINIIFWEFSYVSLASCVDQCAKSNDTESYPVRPGKKSILKRQMSQMFDQQTLPRPTPKDQKRQFLRTWVQSIPIDMIKKPE